jgi:hypothetical protein
MPALQALGESEGDVISIFKTLHRVGSLLNLDCGDNSCMFLPREKKTGMRTNGGCSCDPAAEIEKLLKDHKTLVRVDEWYARTTSSDKDELCDAMDELGNRILRGRP